MAHYSTIAYSLIVVVVVVDVVAVVVVDIVVVTHLASAGLWSLAFCDSRNCLSGC